VYIEDMKDTMTSREVADFLGVTIKSVQRWEREGRLAPAGRTPTNRRYYKRSEILRFQGRVPVQVVRRVIAYCRVSSAAQKPDLLNQRRVMEEFCVARGLANVEFIDEIGGGLNFERKKFLAIMDDVSMGRVETLVIAHRDRLTRFGFEWFERHCRQNDCALLVLNQERLSPEQEMVQDLMTIVHCFSSRLYGLRNYRKKLDEALKSEISNESPSEVQQ
jgi:putative resolvase